MRKGLLNTVERAGVQYLQSKRMADVKSLVITELIYTKPLLTH